MEEPQATPQQYLQLVLKVLLPDRMIQDSNPDGFPRELKEATCEKLKRSNSELKDEILCLVKELKEEKSKHSEQDELMVDISKR
ncbi:cTAGE family member 8 [Plecturocebus cupreus]